MSSDLRITNAHYLDVAAGIYRDGDIQVTNGIITGISKSQSPKPVPRMTPRENSFCRD